MKRTLKQTRPTHIISLLMPGHKTDPRLFTRRNEKPEKVARMMETAAFQLEEIKVGVPWGQVTAKCWHSKFSNPILVAHGLNENAGSFDRLIPLLPKDYYYVVVDLPGHGFSSPFPDGLPLDFMNYVLQLRRIVLHFRWKKFIMMGHSFGAHIAEFYAATFTGEVESLILLEGWSPTPMAKEVYLVSHRNRLNEVLAAGNRVPRLYTYDEALTATMRGRWSRLNSAAAVALLGRSLRKTEAGYIFASDPRTRWEIRPALDENGLLYIFKCLRCPVLVVLGLKSEQKCLQKAPGFYTKVLDILKKTHPLSRIVRVEGNHCLHNNNPEVVAPVITGFLLNARSHL